MRKHNLRTTTDRRVFTVRRNGSLGSLHMAKKSIELMINSDLVGQLDKILLNQALLNITNVIDNWDKHYCAKLFKKLDEEANNENISNQS